MFKGYKMIKYLLIAFSLTIFLQANPYKELDSTIKLNLMINHFLNDELKKIVPPKPIKKKLKDDGLSLDPVKYEQYYNYIQRIKAITDSRVEAQNNINEKFEGKVGFYNGKLKKLKRFYEKEKNINPILQKSINKAFKVVYGKPKFINISYNKKDNIIYGILHIEDIYNIDKFEDKKIKIDIPKKDREYFLKIYEKVKVLIAFKYKNNNLYLKDITYIFNNKKYKANFVKIRNKKIKLNIKINDDIFQLIKIEDKK